MPDIPTPYDFVTQELKDGHITESLWVEAFAKAGGDQDRTLAIYVNLRAEVIRQAIVEGLEKDRQKREAERNAELAAKRKLEREYDEAQRRSRQAEWAEIRRQTAGTFYFLLALVFIIGLIALLAGHR